jgi:hypothetical protein
VTASGCSRRLYLAWRRDQTLRSLLMGHLQAFDGFGGLAEEIR